VTLASPYRTTAVREVGPPAPWRLATVYMDGICACVDEIEDVVGHFIAISVLGMFSTPLCVPLFACLALDALGGDWRHGLRAARGWLAQRRSGRR